MPPSLAEGLEKDLAYCRDLFEARFRYTIETSHPLVEQQYASYELDLLHSFLIYIRELESRPLQRMLRKPQQAVTNVQKKINELRESMLSQAVRTLRKHQVDPRTVIMECSNPNFSFEYIREEVLALWAPEQLRFLRQPQAPLLELSSTYEPSITSTVTPSIISAGQSLAVTLDSTETRTVIEETAFDDDNAFSRPLEKHEYELSEFTLFNKGRMEEWLELEAKMTSTRVLIRDDDDHQSVYIDEAEPIGTGGFGEVFKGGWIIKGAYGGDVVAKKNRFTPNEPSSERRDFQQRLQREAEIAKCLNHVNIAQYIGLFFYNLRIDRRDLYLVSSYCIGGTAREYLNRYKGAKHAEKLFSDLVNGLAYMHSESSQKAKVCHGDLKGNNFLVDWVQKRDRGKAYLIGKITDFGLSSVVTHEFKQSNSKVSNAQRWLAPELARLEDDTYETREPLLEKADIWSFSLTAIEIVLNEDPFEKQIPKGSRFRQDVDFILALTAEPCTLCDHLPTTNPTSGRLSDIAFNTLTSCWKLDPADRPYMSDVRVVYQIDRLGIGISGDGHDDDALF